MQLEIYPILLIVAIIIFYSFGKKKDKHLDAIEHENEELNNLRFLIHSSFKYIVIVRSDHKIYKTYEDNDLGKIGYHIYSKFGQSIDKLNVYIKDNETKVFMLIEKDKDSESMFAIDHPENGFIGFLRFEEVDKI